MLTEYVDLDFHDYAGALRENELFLNYVVFYVYLFDYTCIFFAQ